VRSFGPDGEPSAIGKHPVYEAMLCPTGFETDARADLISHGGPDKAVNLYPFEHYRWWAERTDSNPGLKAMPAFGENFTTSGMLETEVCIGGWFRLGGAVLEVSQGRKPCWKLNHAFGRKDIVRLVTKSVQCGWYFRVLQPGLVRRTDTLIFVDRGWSGMTVDRAFRLLFQKPLEIDALIALAERPELAESWRSDARRRLEDAVQ
jgi:MOSC domain-containing protein YiiM